MSDDTQIAKMGQSLPKTNQPQQPIQANLNQYGNESTQIAYVQHYDATTNQTVLIMQGTQPASGTVIGQGVTFNYDCFNFFVLGTEQYDGATFMGYRPARWRTFLKTAILCICSTKPRATGKSLQSSLTFRSSK